jgi:hypothetical protein
MERPDTWTVTPKDERPTRLDFTCLAGKIIKETGPHNSLKQLYSKYVLEDDGNQKKFSGCCAGTISENHKVDLTTD